MCKQLAKVKPEQRIATHNLCDIQRSFQLIKGHVDHFRGFIINVTYRCEQLFQIFTELRSHRNFSDLDLILVRPSIPLESDNDYCDRVLFSGGSNNVINDNIDN